MRMGKGKPRHDPNKRQNRIGSVCPWYEEIKDKDGKIILRNCEAYLSSKVIEICKGNPHNCIKVKYRYLAARSDKQKNNGDDKISYFGMR